MTVTFLVKVGKAPLPEMQIDAFGAMYCAGEQYAPKCMRPDGAIVDMHSDGLVPLDHKLLFVDVPESGRLVPVVRAPMPEVGILRIKDINLNPATNGGQYLLDFASQLLISVSPSEGTGGHVCGDCHGVGYTW